MRQRRWDSFVPEQGSEGPESCVAVCSARTRAELSAAASLYPDARWLVVPWPGSSFWKTCEVVEEVCGVPPEVLDVDLSGCVEWSLSAACRAALVAVMTAGESNLLLLT